MALLAPVRMSTEWGGGCVLATGVHEEGSLHVHAFQAMATGSKWIKGQRDVVLQNSVVWQGLVESQLASLSPFLP